MARGPGDALGVPAPRAPEPARAPRIPVSVTPASQHDLGLVALIGPNGRPRPAYRVLQRATCAPAARARRPARAEARCAARRVGDGAVRRLRERDHHARRRRPARHADGVLAASRRARWRRGGHGRRREARARAGRRSQRSLHRELRLAGRGRRRPPRGGRRCGARRDLRHAGDRRDRGPTAAAHAPPPRCSTRRASSKWRSAPAIRASRARRRSPPARAAARLPAWSATTTSRPARAGGGGGSARQRRGRRGGRRRRGAGSHDRPRRAGRAIAEQRATTTRRRSPAR